MATKIGITYKDGDGNVFTAQCVDNEAQVTSQTIDPGASFGKLITIKHTPSGGAPLVTIEDIEQAQEPNAGTSA